MSLGSTQPFRPAGTTTVSAATSSVAAALTGRGEAALITNLSSGTAFIRFGTDTSILATTADMPIPAGTRMLLHCGTFAGTVAVVLATGSGVVYVTRGDGTVY